MNNHIGRGLATIGACIFGAAAAFAAPASIEAICIGVVGVCGFIWGSSISE